MSEKFDFEEALKALKSGQAITGKDGVLAPLIKQLTEAALEGEIESHIANDVVPNRRNGKSKKTIKSSQRRDRSKNIVYVWAWYELSGYCQSRQRALRH